MGYFAVLGSGRSVQVSRCHLNLWVLGGALGHRFFFDIGLGIRVSASDDGAPRPECAKLRLALPFSVEPNTFENLKPDILSKRTASLIFGTPVAVTEDEQLRYREKNGEEVVLKVIAAKAHLDPDDISFSGAAVSVWTVTFPNVLAIPQQGSVEYYVRLRFRVREFARAYVDETSGPILDLRVCDVRESGAGAEWDSLAEQMLPIERLNVFAIVPSHLKQRFLSPQPKYVRILEGSVWQSYLRRRPYLWGDQKLCVYYWRQDEEVTGAKPFRAFVDFQDTSRHVTRTYIVLAVALTTAVVLATILGLWHNPHYPSELYAALRANLLIWGFAATLVSALKLAHWLAKNYSWFGTAATWLRKKEDRVYKMRLASK